MGSGGGKGSTWDWVLNPIGTGGNALLGFDIDPIGSVISGATKYAFNLDDARDQGNMFGTGGMGIHDYANQSFGGTSAESRFRADDPGWQAYFASAGLTPEGTPKSRFSAQPEVTAENAPELSKPVTDKMIRRQATPMKAPQTSLLDEDYDG